MSANPFADHKNPTTRKFLCCLHNRTDTNEGRLNGLMAIEVYINMEKAQGLPYAEWADRFWIIYQLVTGCEEKGYIERYWWLPPSLRWGLGKLWWSPAWFDIIRITPDGIRLCNSIEEDGKSYCASSKAPSCKD
jgi:hypothetical protein